jgi:hypothetical protein
MKTPRDMIFVRGSFESVADLYEQGKVTLLPNDSNEWRVSHRGMTFRVSRECYLWIAVKEGRAVPPPVVGANRRYESPLGAATLRRAVEYFKANPRNTARQAVADLGISDACSRVARRQVEKPYSDQPRAAESRTRKIKEATCAPR